MSEPKRGKVKQKKTASHASPSKAQGRLQNFMRGVRTVEAHGNAVDVRSAKVLLLTCVGVLVVIGLVMVYSATSADLSSKGVNPFTDVIQQGAFAALGAAGMVFVWRVIPYRMLVGRIFWMYYAFCILLLLLTIFFGTEVNGAKRWLYIGSVGLQPSEFIKIALLLMTIRIINELRDGAIYWQAAIFQLAVAVALPLFIMYVTQSDLGTTLICAIGIFSILWLGGISSRWLVGIGFAVCILAVIAVFGAGYRSSRFVYLDPWNDGQNGLGTGYNIIRSYYAISEGGIFGMGIGSSHEKYDYLFASESDFIFAIICEELGLVGAVTVIVLFLVLLFMGLRIARGCEDDFGRMVAGGFIIMLVFQAFLNIGCVIGVFPTTGKPLPFISSGGSSIISSLLIIGIILSVERDIELGGSSERRRENLRVIRPPGRNPTSSANRR